MDGLDHSCPDKHTRLRHQSSICLNYGKFVSSGSRVRACLSFERGVWEMAKLGTFIIASSRHGNDLLCMLKRVICGIGWLSWSHSSRSKPWDLVKAGSLMELDCHYYSPDFDRLQ